MSTLKSTTDLIHKISHIRNEINEIENTSIFIIDAKKQCLENYENRLNELERIKLNKVLNYDFVAEVYRKSEVLQKTKLVQNIIDKSFQLEIHKYAPELNKLVLRNKNKISVANCVEFSHVKKKLLKLSLSELQNICLNNQISIL